MQIRLDTRRVYLYLFSPYRAEPCVVSLLHSSAGRLVVTMLEILSVPDSSIDLRREGYTSPIKLLETADSGQGPRTGHRAHTPTRIEENESGQG